jgi:hypothetical protein
MSEVLNNANEPLLIATDNRFTTFGEIITISRILSPKVRIMLTSDKTIPDLHNGYYELFVFEPSKKFLTQIATTYHAHVHPVNKCPGLLELD